MDGISGFRVPSLFGQISSGNRLTTAANGAAELAITKNEQAQITGTDTGTKNLETGADMLKTSDSALGSITSTLQRMRELAVQATNSTLNNQNRTAIQNEVNQLKDEINQVAANTRFNGINLTDGSQPQGVQLTADAGGSSLTVNSLSSSMTDALGIADFDVTKKFDVKAIDNAIAQVSSQRSTIGAQSNRIASAMNYNGYASVNLTASKSRMGDTDIAKALQELTHQQTLQSVSQMLQKKNMQQKGQNTLDLLQV